jgi:hypothetical protein
MTQLLLHLAVLQQDSGPDIIPEPNADGRPANVGGLVVAAVLVLGWLLAGALLFRRARRRG